MIRPFINNATWADKVEVHNNERKTSTYFNQARIAEQLESTGRFAEQARPSITGEAPAVHYPAAASPWSGPQPPPEEPLGFAVGNAPVVGEPHEVIRAAEILAAREALAEKAPVGSASVGAEPADPAVPVVDRGSAIPADRAARLQELLGQGIVRRRKL